MAKSLVGALALVLLPSALAFRDSSPYFLFSSADLDLPNDDVDVVGQLRLLNEIIGGAIEDCPTKTYFVVTQNGVSSADYLDGRTAPRLGHYLSGKNEEVRSIMVVPEVIEEVPESKSLATYVRQQCDPGSKARTGERAPLKADAQVIEVSFPAPSSSQRAAELEKNDAELERLIAERANTEDFTVIYLTTPPSEEQATAVPEKPHTYEMEDPFGEAVQMELKRDLLSHKRAASKQEGGLFEKYQYFSPGIFMAFAAIAPLFLIITVGLKALSSLEVSYFAFSKEMGPAAQRKQ